MKKFFKNFDQISKLVFESSPKLIILNLIAIFLSGIVSVCMIQVTSHFFDTINSTKNASFIFSSFLFFVLSYLFKELLIWIIDFTDYKIDKKIYNFANEIIHKKISNISRIKYEDPNFVEKIELANTGVFSIGYYFFNIYGLILQDVPYLIMLGFTLFKYRPLLIITPIIIFIPILITQLINLSSKKKLKKDLIYYKKKLTNYSNILTAANYIKETRLLGTYSFFMNKFKEMLKNVNNKTWVSEKQVQLKNLISKTINLLGYCAVIYILFRSLIDNYITIGEFAAVFASIRTVYSMVNKVVVNRIGGILTYDYTDLKYFIDLLNEEEEEFGIKLNNSFEQIELNDVSFKYPNRKDYALKNINLILKKGETIAIVGKNGSGKTTLSKILLGLFDPVDGYILYNGFNKNCYLKNEFYKDKSAVFQNFYKYLYILKDNIRISNISDNDIEDKQLKLSCGNAELDFENESVFPSGFDTMLSKQFGGVDLSGGEWQKIAFARSFYKNYNFIVLDEPTSAIDPIEEAKIYAEFAQIVKDKTALIITHRLSAVKLADKIIVLDEGKIIENGTHNELIEKKGVYYNMFLKQKEWYDI